LGVSQQPTGQDAAFRKGRFSCQIRLNGLKLKRLSGLQGERPRQRGVAQPAPLGLRPFRSARQKPRTRERGPRYPTRQLVRSCEKNLPRWAGAPAAAGAFSKKLVTPSQTLRSAPAEFFTASHSSPFLEPFQHPHVAILNGARHGEVLAIR
jgi:hypothetical protein